MADKRTKIWFITWPNGNVFEGTQTSIDEKFAIVAAINTWLHKDWFPGLDLLNSYSARNELWNAMQRAGFKCQCIELPAELAEGVSR